MVSPVPRDCRDYSLRCNCKEKVLVLLPRSIFETEIEIFYADGADNGFDDSRQLSDLQSC